jgi:hypothetical protein
MTSWLDKGSISTATAGPTTLTRSHVRRAMIFNIYGLDDRTWASQTMRCPRPEIMSRSQKSRSLLFTIGEQCMQSSFYSMPNSFGLGMCLGRASCNAIHEKSTTGVSSQLNSFEARSGYSMTQSSFLQYMIVNFLHLQ